ncbi:hypothetical protein KUL156_00670 [Alteromonas sp. KUL156]|nr:hypothetical protein KUL154_39820 [Alteromonas sp. KUL154]GFD97474.1 hypothetical protein KUL156_00670 [Alteromonas sp. KUL156]
MLYSLPQSSIGVTIGSATNVFCAIKSYMRQNPPDCIIHISYMLGADDLCYMFLQRVVRHLGKAEFM